MFSVLLIMKGSDTQEDLVDDLLEAFPDLHLVTRTDIEGAKTALRHAYAKETPFDVTILDSELLIKNGNLTTNKGIELACPVAQTCLLYLNWNAPTDSTKAEGEEHLLRTAYFLPYPKDILDIGKDLIVKLKGIFLLKQLCSLIGHSNSYQIRGRRRKLSSRTHELMLFNQNLLNYWQDIDTEERNILSCFVHVDSQRQIVQFQSNQPPDHCNRMKSRRMPLDYDRIQSLLDDNRLSPQNHFEIHFASRNPWSGRGQAKHGVAHTDLINRYMNVLEDLWAFMQSREFTGEDNVEVPITPIHVYLCDTREAHDAGPIMRPDHNGRLTIYLPCRFWEPLTLDAQFYAEVAAAHEAAHCFTYTWRQQAIQPYLRATNARDTLNQRWRWLDEATALHVETLLLKKRLGCLPYCMDWNDAPELSIDHDNNHYRGLLFTRFLQRHTTHSFLYRVWTSQRPDETAIQTIDRLLQTEGKELYRSDPEKPDLFSDYCIDAYFLADHKKKSLEYKVHAQYGERFIAHSFDLTLGMEECFPPQNTSMDLYQMACQYIRIRLPTQATQLTLEWSNNSSETMKAILVAAKPGEHRLYSAFKSGANKNAVYLVPNTTNDRYTADVLLSDTRAELDHLVLIIANYWHKATGHCKQEPDAYSVRLIAN